MRPMHRCGALLLAFCAVGLLPGQDEPEAKKVKIGSNVYFEKQGDNRRVVIDAYVCLRQGQLEQLLTRKNAKEHEAIVAADIDATHVQIALLLTGAKPGHPVKFLPKFVPPAGTPIKVYLEYQDQGKRVRVPGQQWVRNIKSRKDLDTDWVFAGSVLVPDPLNNANPPFFAANQGDIICIANFEAALLDVPFSSTKDNDDLAFEAHTERIPPLGTRVQVVLEPVVAKKK